MRFVLLALLSACASRPPTQVPTTADTPAAEGEVAPLSPIPRAELASERTPPSPDEARRLLVGRWDGKRYDYDSEHAFAGDEGDEPRELIELGVDGRYRLVTEACETTGRYEVESDDYSGLTLRLFRERNCRGDGPYNYPSRIHRLDDGMLVLIDGMTAGTSAYRRASITPTNQGEGG